MKLQRGIREVHGLLWACPTPILHGASNHLYHGQDPTRVSLGVIQQRLCLLDRPRLQ